MKEKRQTTRLIANKRQQIQIQIETHYILLERDLLNENN